MEWVETTGKSVDDALDAALDQLGVDEADAEYEVLEEPKVGLFGRLRGEARVRARVRPTKPRPKEDRRERRRRSGSKTGSAEGAAAVATSEEDPPVVGFDDDGREERRDERPDERPRGPRRANGARRNGAREEEQQVSETGVDVPLDEQGDVAVAFVSGLLAQLEATATVDRRLVDDDTLEIVVEGQDLGLLIGPKGATLASLQELMRTVVQRRTSARNGRLLLEVAGYRQRRKEALERFARTAAEQVLATGSRVVLEPMSAADRKIIHDTVNTIDGVATTSQGEEPRRRVVLLPEGNATA